VGLNKQVRNFSSLFIVQLLNYLLPIITLPIVVRIIGPEKFGIINYLSSFVGYFVLLIGYSYELSATRIVTANQGDQTLLN
jgi:PST family polysaccharide transporter